jgi:hypothetical protein
MCGRFTFQPTEEFYQRFHLANRLDTLVARYNIAPSQLVPVIISQSPNQVVLYVLGSHPPLGQGRKGRLQDDQRTRGDPRPAAGLPQLACRQSLPSAGQRLFRMEGGTTRQNALLHPPQEQ